MDSLVPGWGPCIQPAALARARLLNTRSAKHMLVVRRREDGMAWVGREVVPVEPFTMKHNILLLRHVQWLKHSIVLNMNEVPYCPSAGEWGDSVVD